MTKIIHSLDEIAGGYEAILCDLWGCYHDGIAPFPAAIAACQAFRARGGVVILLTNAPRPSAQVARFLDRIGGPRDSYDAICSSGGACQAALASGAHGAGFHYVGPERDLHMLSEVGLAPVPLEQASAILLTGLRDDQSETPADYAAELADWAARGLTVLCANPDIMVDRGEQRLWCAGALARDYERMGGTVLWFGKPHAPVYQRCYDVVAETAGRALLRGRILAIGDGIQTDIAGGVAEGLDTLFVTGGLAATEMGRDPEAPDPARLSEYLRRHKLAPTYAIGRLR